jgi:flagellar basal-body rod modification protein FlgD
LGYVGMDISYVSGEMYHETGTESKVNFVLSETASLSKINIYNEAGEIVRTMEAPKTTGAHTVMWDGKDNNGNVVETGTYGIKVDALNKENKSIAVSPVVSGNVRGIESQNGVVYLLVGDRAVSLGSVIQASNKPAATPTPPATDEAA